MNIHIISTIVIHKGSLPDKPIGPTLLAALQKNSTLNKQTNIYILPAFQCKFQTDLLLVIAYTHWSGKSYQNYTKCDEQIVCHHVLTTLTIWLTGRWSLVKVKLTLTDGQSFLQQRTIWLSLCNMP